LYALPAADALSFVFVGLLMIPVIIDFRKAVAKEDQEKASAAVPAADNI
jgi:hypothetical protein